MGCFCSPLCCIISRMGCFCSQPKLPDSIPETDPINPSLAKLSYAQTRRECTDGEDGNTSEGFRGGGFADLIIEASSSATALPLTSNAQPDVTMQSLSISIHHEEKGSVSARHPEASTDGDACESFQSDVSPDLRIPDPFERFPESGNEVEGWNSYRFFARDVCESLSTGDMTDGNPSEPVHQTVLTIQESRAWNRMIILTDSQLEVLMSYINISVGDNRKDNKVAKVKELLEWRRRRGDFGNLATPDDEVERVLLQAPDMQPLPWDAQTWTKEMLLGYPRPDLQLECLLRALDYDGHHTKSQLVEKLMVFERSSMLSQTT
ncbi:hypothetical protein KP509_1Z145800 [Ceratopteris richardii]|nr:hypothetical protein KP509_1Z145800 [Ceratopteris richardii]